MKTIKIYNISYDIKTLYRKANSPAQRALAGYMIKSGQTYDPIFGGAFHFLRVVERCVATEEIYEIYNCTDDETKQKIIHIAQLAIDGDLDKFVLSEREINNTLKSLSEYQ